MSNAPDMEAILRDAQRQVALAKLHEFERQAFRIGEYVHFGFVSRTDAGDILHNIACANGLIGTHGTELIQNILWNGLENAWL